MYGWWEFVEVGGLMSYGTTCVPAPVLRSDPGGEGDERAHPCPRLLTCGRGSAGAPDQASPRHRRPARAEGEVRRLELLYATPSSRALPIRLRSFVLPLSGLRPGLTR